MHQTHERKKKTGTFTIELPPLKPSVKLPISVQVQQAALASSHKNNKRNTRNKQNTWKQEQGV